MFGGGCGQVLAAAVRILRESRWPFGSKEYLGEKTIWPWVSSPPQQCPFSRAAVGIHSAPPCQLKPLDFSFPTFFFYSLLLFLLWLKPDMRLTCSVHLLLPPRDPPGMHLPLWTKTGKETLALTEKDLPGHHSSKGFPWILLMSFPTKPRSEAPLTIAFWCWSLEKSLFQMSNGFEKD